MNRIQFWILTGTSTLVALAYIVQIFLGRNVQSSADTFQQERERALFAEQKVAISRQIEGGIYKLSQQDPALRDLLNRQGVTLSIPAGQAAAQAQH